jgi:hypothetical protein
MLSDLLGEIMMNSNVRHLRVLLSSSRAEPPLAPEEKPISAKVEVGVMGSEQGRTIRHSVAHR